MKKFLTVALLCGFVGMPALAEVPFFDQDDVFVLDGTKSYGCDLTNSWVGGQAAYVDYNVTGGYLQSFGDAVLNGRQVGTHVRFLCDAGNDEWDIVDTKWCSGTEVDKTGVAFAVYEMRAGGSVYKTAAAHKDGCIFAQCEKGRAYFSGQCLSQEEINQRKEMCDGKPQGTVENVTVEECKRVWANKDGVNAIMACTKKCGKNANGAGVWKVSVTQCMVPYRVVNAGGVACKLDNNGGNGGGNGGNGAVSCKNGSSPNILSQDNCVQGTTFKCGQKDKKGICECGYCFKIINGHRITVGSCPEKIVTRLDCEKEGKDFRALAYGIPEDWLPGEVHPAVTYEVCGECVAKPTTPGNTNPGNTTPAKKTRFQKCLEERKGNKEGTACCYLPENVATFDGKCNCVAPNMEFKIGNDGRGQCNAKPAAPGATFNCDSIVLGVLDGWLAECAKKAQIVSIITQIKALCSSESRTADQFNTLYQTLLALNPGECVEQPVQVIQQPVVPTIDEEAEKLKKSRIKISDSHGALRGMLKSFKVSVWKDEEGKFNTARLASDSIAAVVLGTTGALVTSHVVKKNQVENGFEDIKCTIGGQTVADWGDEFRVGIQ